MQAKQCTLLLAVDPSAVLLCCGTSTDGMLAVSLSTLLLSTKLSLGTSRTRSAALLKRWSSASNT